MRAVRVQAKPLLTVQVSRETAMRVVAASKRIDQSIAAWLRLAIVEKLERDES